MAKCVFLLATVVAVLYSAAGESLHDACLPLVQVAVNVIKENKNDMPEELAKVFEISGFFDDNELNKDNWILLLTELYYSTQELSDEDLENVIDEVEFEYYKILDQIDAALENLDEKDIKKCIEKFDSTVSKISDLLF